MSTTHNKLWHDRTYLQLGIALLAALALFYTQMSLEPILVVGVSLLPLILVVAFRKPYIAIVLFMAFSFFRLHEAYPVIKPLRLILVTSLLSLAVLVWHAFFVRSIRPAWTRELVLLLLFFLLVTLALPFAFDEKIAFKYWGSNYVKIIVMVVPIAWMIRSANDFNWTSRIIIIGGILVAARTIYNRHYGISLVEGTRVTIGREETKIPFNLEDPELPPLSHLLTDNPIKAVLADPNDLALVLLFPLGFTVAFMIYRSGVFNTLLGLLGTPMIIMAIIATQSRGGLLGVMTVFGIAGLRVIRSRIVLGLLGAVAFVFLFLAMGIGDRSSGGFSDLSQRGGLDESSGIRLTAWHSAINMVIHHPLTGVGLDNYSSALDVYSTGWMGKINAVHSTWFGVLAETGLPGFIIFVTMIAVTIRTAITNMNSLCHGNRPDTMKATALAQVAGLASFCVAGTFLTQGFTWPIYILLALTIATSLYARDNAEPSGETAAENPRSRPDRG